MMTSEEAINYLKSAHLLSEDGSISGNSPWIRVCDFQICIDEDFLSLKTLEAIVVYCNHKGWHQT